MGAEARLGAAIGAPVLLEPIPLRNALGAGSLVLLSLVLLGFGAWGATEGDRGMFTTILPAGLGLFTLLAGAALFYQRSRSRGSLALYEQGFVCEGASGRTALRFDEVDSLALRQKSRTSYGTLVGMDRRATVRGPAGTLRFGQFSPAGKPDSVAPLLNDLVGRLVDVAEARMRAGGSLDGEGWSLGPGGFSAKAGEIPVPAESLARAGLFEHKVSLWRDGDEGPFFSVRDEAPNALVLGRLVGRRVRGKAEATPAGELGRVLFVRRSRKSAVYTVLGGLALLALGFFLGSRNVAGNDRLIALGMTAAGILCLPISVLLWAKACRRHENGLSMAGLFGQRQILYTDVERMSYSAVQHYHNGIYTGTQILLAAYPAAGKPIVFSAHSRGDSEDIDNLREDLAQRIAGKLYARLAHEPEVPWTPRVRLSRQGIRFERQKFVGRGEEMFVHFTENPQIEIKAGTLHLSAPGRKGTLLRVPCMAQNFYPGFILFQALRNEAAQG